MMSKYLAPVLLLIISLVFFYPVVLSGRIPIASDTIVGLYHPYRDFFATEYPNGIPFKNFLLTDPVRQQYPWRRLSIDAFRQGSLPLWNPYNAAGMPLMANMQSAAFYPLNLLYFILPFTTAWTVQIFLQLVLSGIFMYLYLRFLKLQRVACFLGALVFSFSGASVAWLEWNTIGQTMLWIPLVLLMKEKLIKKWSMGWFFLAVFAESSLILAGHLQSAFYALLLINIYLFVRILQKVRDERSKRSLVLISLCARFLFIGLVVLFITAAQWIPTLQLIGESARSIDQLNWQKEGWFLPWQNLVQFVAPDFFGNPSTLNYWGIWNYAEFIGYIGLLPLLMGLLALVFRRDKKTAFFGTVFFISILFSLPTFFAKLPYLFAIPFLSSAQPTRLMLISDFTLSILAALGLDYFLPHKKKLIYPIIFLFLLLIGLVLITVFFSSSFGMKPEQAVIAMNNLKLPAVTFAVILVALSLFIFIRRTSWQKIFVYLLLLISLIDLLRFGWKFTPFSQPSYLYPSTALLQFLKDDTSRFRIMATDDRILPPNFSSIYNIESVDVYDPLYLERYGEFVAAMERNVPNIMPPFGFNRIIAPHAYSSKFVNLLNIKYILSFQDISSVNFRKVFSEGSLGVYENSGVYPRAYFVEKVTSVSNKQDAIRKMFSAETDLRRDAVIERGEVADGLYVPSLGKLVMDSYTPEKVIFSAKTNADEFLVFLDANYPSWHAYIENNGKRSEVRIFQTDFLFRGVYVPKGDSIITFQANLL